MLWPFVATATPVGLASGAPAATVDTAPPTPVTRKTAAPAAFVPVKYVSLPSGDGAASSGCWNTPARAATSTAVMARSPSGADLAPLAHPAMTNPATVGTATNIQAFLLRFIDHLRECGAPSGCRSVGLRPPRCPRISHVVNVDR